jgi:hypothetical protein
MESKRKLVRMTASKSKDEEGQTKTINSGRTVINS